MLTKIRPGGVREWSQRRNGNSTRRVSHSSYETAKLKEFKRTSRSECNIRAFPAELLAHGRRTGTNERAVEPACQAYQPYSVAKEYWLRSRTSQQR